MARDHRSDEQDNLFPTHSKGEEPDFSTDSPPEAGDPAAPAPGPDLSSEEERLRSGDIAFRPLSLPGSQPEQAERRGGAGGTALMIVAAIIVVFLLTYVIYTFYSPSPSGQESAATGETAPVQEPPAGPDRTGGLEDSGAVFQAHAELQEQYRLAEKQVAELEAELATLRSASPGTVRDTGADAGDPDRLARLEAENRDLKTDLELQRQESESAVSRAEGLVQRAEAQVARERDQTAAAQQEAEQARQQAVALAGEGDGLRDRIAELEAEVIERRSDYERLAAASTTRLEGESAAVRQLIGRHAEELERQARKTREKEEEIQRLTQLIARLSVTDTNATAGEPERMASTTAPAAAVSTAGTGVDTPPRILSWSNPVYPVTARRLRVEGTVLLNVLVGPDGKVMEVKILEADGGKLLSPAAVDAVRQWTFTPATRGGKPVACWHKVPIRFAL